MFIVLDLVEIWDLGTIIVSYSKVTDQVFVRQFIHGGVSLTGQMKQEIQHIIVNILISKQHLFTSHRYFFTLALITNLRKVNECVSDGLRGVVQSLITVNTDCHPGYDTQSDQVESNPQELATSPGILQEPLPPFLNSSHLFQHLLQITVHMLKHFVEL